MFKTISSKTIHALGSTLTLITAGLLHFKAAFNASLTSEILFT